MERRNMCVHAAECNPVGQSVDAVLIFRRHIIVNHQKEKSIVIQQKVLKLCFASCECLLLLKYFPFFTL